jgi:iron complex outermembrane receptor protein
MKIQVLLSFILLSSLALTAQTKEKVKDSLPLITLEEVQLIGIRANEDTPVTFSNITKRELAPRNLGQDIPILLNYLPAVVTTSDAGAGIGYTGIRVRGSDATRVNVTINGIPYNDSESQGTFWVNLPDFALLR